MEKGKLTVEDMVRLSEEHSIVKIETSPGKLESLNPMLMDLSDILKIVSSSMSEALNQRNDLLVASYGTNFQPDSDKCDEERLYAKMNDYLMENNIVAIISYGDYDKETLEAYRLLKKLDG